MGSHPINLVFRFFLELVTLFSMGLWAWRQGDGWLRFILAVGVPLLFAVLWGVFAVPDDPSRSGAAPIPVPGLLRLFLELIFFTVGVWMLRQSGYQSTSIVLGLAIIIHYILSYDRIMWLLQR